MYIPFSRRQLWKLVPLVLPLDRVEASAPAASDAFPAQQADIVREMVSVAHGNLKRVQELVEARPALAKAAIDWGFGDWEDALGAASHTGRRDIAEYLIANGARPTLFSATMLGQLDAVKAFLAAHPGAQRIPGPHSISLLTHAKNGGKQAEAVYNYLESLGGAGAPPRAELSQEEAAALAGTYVYGNGANDRIEIIANKAQLIFVRKGTVGRPLMHVGNHAFYPAGASAVRIRFTESVLTVHDPDQLFTARRI